MKNFKDIILEKLKVTPKNTDEFKIQTISSDAPIVLTLMMSNIDFHMFDYENYITNVLDTDIVISPARLKNELNYSKSTLRDHLPKFLNNILTIMNTSKSDQIKFSLQYFIKIINKHYTDKKLEVKISYANPGVDSEKYLLIFNAYEGGFKNDNILILQISK